MNCDDLVYFSAPRRRILSPLCSVLLFPLRAFLYLYPSQFPLRFSAWLYRIRPFFSISGVCFILSAATSPSSSDFCRAPGDPFNLSADFSLLFYFCPVEQGGLESPRFIDSLTWDGGRRFSSSSHDLFFLFTQVFFFLPLPPVFIIFPPSLSGIVAVLCPLLSAADRSSFLIPLGAAYRKNFSGVLVCFFGIQAFRFLQIRFS